MDNEEESNLTIDKDGAKEWRNKSGELHRIGGPAVEHRNGTKEWFQNGKLHRIEGPAIEYFSGTKCWYQNGKLHRLDGPAVEHTNGDKKWWQNGLLHRIEGPAVEYRDGDKMWYYRGYRFENKEDFFEALTEEEKEIALFSKDFHNA
jgi:hypothetical protein